MHGINTFVPHFFSHIQGMCIVVTSDIVSEVLHVPRVAHPDYPSCACLRTVSKDELSYLFCETPSSQGDHQNTPCSGFAKGLRFLNMVMTFILHPLSHYNSITESRARFLLSLLEDIYSTFLLTSFYPLQMFIGIRRPMISSFFLQLSRRSFAIFLSPFLSLLTSWLCVLQMQLPFDGARHSSDRGSPG